MQPVDWCDMFRRYAELVETEEGISFLNRGDWSPAEVAAIRALRPDADDRLPD